MKKQFTTLLMVLLAGILLTGCGSGGGNSKKNASNSTGFLIYGIASKGPIKVGFVTVHALDTTGTPGGLLGTTITADDGSYAVDIGTYTGNILVEVKKGTYIDEATIDEATQVVKTNESMRAAVTQVKGSAVVMVTPFTEIAVRKAGALTTDNIENANALAGTMAGGADIIGTRPANVLNAEECANAASYEIDYGLALASLSSMVKEGHVASIPDAMAKISEDLKDGKLNDHGVHLKDSLLAFLNNPNNQSGVTDPGQIEIDESIVFFSENSIMDDTNSINQMFRTMEGLYSASNPSEDDIKGWFDINAAVDYLQDGNGSDEEAADWSNGGGLYEGISLSAVILNTMDIAGTTYEKGYRIKLYFSGSKGWGSLDSSIVFDEESKSWLWYGNREWGLGLGNFIPKAEMTVDADGYVSFNSGFAAIIWDENLYSYYQGARSAIITGPGLPEDGLKLSHYYPESYLGLYPPGTGFIYHPDDSVIPDIPDNSEYVINIYKESVDSVSLINNTPIMTKTRTLARGPVLNSKLNASLFPDMITPVSHDLIATNIPGSLGVSWSNPSQMTVDYISLGWLGTDDEEQLLSINPGQDPGVEEGATAVTFTTTEYPAAKERAQMYMHGMDTYGRRFSLTWQFWEQQGPQEEVDAVNELFRSLEEMYATAIPSNEVITAWFDSHVALDYLQDGRDKQEELSAWTDGGGVYEGISLYASLLDPIEVAGYVKGYQVRLYYFGALGSGSFLTSVVYDGSNWLWYGNREWGLGLGDFVPRAEMVLDAEGASFSTSTGFRMIIWDKNNTAYEEGVRSAIITGPGLPADGIKLKHYYPESYFSLYPEGSGYTYILSDDTIIEPIPDNSEYVINFFAEEPDVVSLSLTPVKTNTKTFAKGPVLNSVLTSELGTSFFPTIISPTSHDLSAANIPGSLDISWTNPSQMVVNSISLGWLDVNGADQFVVEYPVYESGVVEGIQTVTLDTTLYSGALFMAQMYLQGSDAYGRSYSLTWPFSSFP